MQGASISGAIPEGSIEVISVEDPRDIRLLRLLEDDEHTVMFYYHFRAIGVRGTECRFSIINAHESVAMRLAGRSDDEHCWNTPGAMASYDLQDWFRVPGKYEDSTYALVHEPEYDACYYASWPPYSLGRLSRLLAKAPVARGVTQARQANMRILLAITMAVIAECFDCLSVLLEQPFKDTSWRIDPVRGWSPQRAIAFDGTLPTVLLRIVDKLR